MTNTPGRNGRPAGGHPRRDDRPRRAEYPNEMCGVIVGTGTRQPADGCLLGARRNAEASPMRYVVHPEDLLRLTIETDDADEVFWAIAHSHVRSPAVPSPTDIGRRSTRTRCTSWSR